MMFRQALLAQVAGEAAEALAGVVVRPHRLLLSELRIRSDLLGHALHLVNRGLTMLRIGQKLVDPGTRSLGLNVVFDEQTAEQNADPDVGERAKGQLAA